MNKRQRKNKPAKRLNTLHKKDKPIFIKPEYIFTTQEIYDKYKDVVYKLLEQE